jgi:hypothetical protein
LSRRRWPPLASAALVFRRAESTGLGAPLGLRAVVPVIPAHCVVGAGGRGVASRAAAATADGAGAAISGSEQAQGGLYLLEAGVEACLFGT